MAEKRTRSTSAPTTRAMVMAAKLIWKQANSNSGIALPDVDSAQALSPSIPLRPALARSPTIGP
jgi:hypothetical protein